MQDYIAVQQQDFSLEAEYQALCSDNQQDGAVLSFIGLVRDFNQGSEVKSLFLEHYAGMTEKSLQGIVAQARHKWQLGRVRVIHRFGRLELGEQIVFVGLTSRHRKNAFEAGEFIMDFLKTQAPFWKKELSAKGDTWLAAKQSDQDEAEKWLS